MLRFPAYIRYLFLVYLSGIGFFTFFRITFVLAHPDIARDVPLKILGQAFLMGFRFDTMVSCYILSVPFIFLAILSFLKIDISRLFRYSNVYFALLFSFSFLICGIDIPYFTHFNSRFTHSALFWFDTPGFILKIVFTTPVYWVYFILFLSLCVIFLFLLKKIKRKILWSMKDIAPRAKPFLFAASAGLIFLGIRGRVEQKSPLRWGTAFFSEYPFANQMGLNPLFTLSKTTIDSYKPQNQKVNFMDEQEALKNVRGYLHVPDSAAGVRRWQISSGHPGGKNAEGNMENGGEQSTEGKKYNVILVLMESMSAKFMGAFGNEKNLTPVLDSLMNESWAFTNFFSSGNHTFNGIYSTLFGMPALMARHPMKDFGNMHQESGIANELRQRGYETMFMCTHDEQFDNMGGYMKQNGFSKIISQKDYRKEDILSTLGVPDHILFREVVSRCNEMKPPFFTTVLTASNHPPVVIPENIDFSSKQDDIDLVSVQYADWSIGQFLKNVQKEKWFDSTYFVFLADHGRFVSGWGYDMPISYYHIPLIIYAPGILKENKKFDQLGSQLDLLATLMGVLNFDFVNTTLGTDILKEKREFVFFNADNNLGCLNDSVFYLQRESGVNSLYYYKNSDITEYIGKHPGFDAQMKLYAESMVQAAQYLREHH